jgi:hypothetical protein
MKLSRAVIAILITLFIIAMAVLIKMRSSSTSGSNPLVGHRTYETNFPMAEESLSEKQNWIGGRTVGLEWSDMQTVPGRAYGVTLGPGDFRDPTALVSGVWGPDQTAEATVYSVDQSDTIYEEVELRLRSNLSAHSCTGYEIDFRVTSSSGAYLAIVRWNGPYADFTYLVTYRGARYGVSNGDVIKASIVGNTISVYKNGVQIGSARDDTFKTGAPGIGTDGPIGKYSNWGLSSFKAHD